MVISMHQKEQESMVEQVFTHVVKDSFSLAIAVGHATMEAGLEKTLFVGVS